MAINKLQDANEIKIPQYRVSFTWRADYEKGCGINSISMNVHAETNFEALDVAWELIRCLNLPEPSEFDAKKKDRC